MLPALLVLTLAWGALAFGAVYQWAYVPLAIACATLGLAGLVRRPPGVNLRPNGTLLAALLLVAAGIALQLVPVPVGLMEVLSPGTATLMQRLHPGAAPFAGSGASAAWHPLSTNPAATARALALFAAFGLFFLGCARGLSARDLRAVLPGLVTLGVVVAFVALFQRASGTGLLYGFWLPRTGPLRLHTGGPFINRNHLAGWLLLALPLALGYFATLLERATETSGDGWRSRTLRLSSPDGSRMLLAAAAIPVMALELVQTFSRSGLAGFFVSVLVAGVVGVRSRLPGRQRWLLAVYLALLVGLVVTGVGLTQLEARLDDVGVSYTERLAVWHDTMRIFGDMPLAGSGLGTYSTVMLIYQTANPLTTFNQAHNDYAQLLAEGGLLVAVPAALFVVLFAREVRRRFRNDTPDRLTYWARVGAVAGLLAIGLQEIVDFSLQMPGNAALCAVVMAIAAGRLPHREGFRVPLDDDHQ